MKYFSDHKPGRLLYALGVKTHLKCLKLTLGLKSKLLLNASLKITPVSN